MKETLRRRIKVMSSLNKISGDQLGLGERGEMLLHLPHPFLKQASETVFLNF
jgi:hypothetical protein